jgi:putative membrane protein insertion efficiency factor
VSTDLPRRCLIGLVRAYRFFLSPWLGSACRFEPTCSAYALGALQQHGALTGSRLTLWRLARCHPWCTGGHDPVPVAPRLFTDLLQCHRHNAALDDPVRTDLRKTSQ